MTIVLGMTVVGLGLAVMFGIIGWGLVEIVVEMFRKRDFEGIYFYDGGRKFHMSSWFERLPGDKFYGYR